MEPSPGARRRAVAAVVVAVGVVGFTTTAVTVGTRGMAAELSLSTVELGWVVNAYLLTGAALVVAGGRLGDVIGRVRTFAAGLAVFAVGSVVGIVAPGFAALVVARILQGAGAALILPATIELVAEYAAPGREDAAFRWRGLVYASSFAIGPLLGGVLTDWSSWRWIFAVDAVVVAAVAIAALPLRRHPGRGAHRPTRDLLGAVLLAGLVAAVVLLGERLAAWGAASTPWIGTAVVAVALAALLVRHEGRTEHPLVHPAILRDRRVLGANLATVGASLGMLSLLYFFNLFAQSATGLDYAALSVAVALVPFVVSLLVCALVAHWLGRRLGPRGPAFVGLGLMVAGFGLLATVSASTTRDDLLVPLVVTGVGAGIANASLTGVAVLHLPAGRENEAAGWLSLSRFLGSAMALAAGTAVFLSVTLPLLAGSGVVLPAPQASGNAFDQAVATLDRDLSGPLLAATNAATAERFARTMLLTAVLLGVVTVISWWLLGGRPDAGDRGQRSRKARFP